jgi:hypothetical protein
MNHLDEEGFRPVLTEEYPDPFACDCFLDGRLARGDCISLSTIGVIVISCESSSETAVVRPSSSNGGTA